MIAFELPPVAENYTGIHKYLCEERGISDTVFKSLIRKGLLYETNKNDVAAEAVFVRHDLSDGSVKAGIIKTSFIDPTIGGSMTKVVPGSETSKALFFFQGHNVQTPENVFLFEDEIDLASFLTIQEAQGADVESFSCAVVNGITTNLKIGENLQNLFNKFPSVKVVYLGFDNDFNRDVNVGRAAATSLASELKQIGMEVKFLDIPDSLDGKTNKDWNDCLRALRETKSL